MYSCDVCMDVAVVHAASSRICSPRQWTMTKPRALCEVVWWHCGHNEASFLTRQCRFIIVHAPCTNINLAMGIHFHRGLTCIKLQPAPMKVRNSQQLIDIQRNSAVVVLLQLVVACSATAARSQHAYTCTHRPPRPGTWLRTASRRTCICI